MRKIEFEENKVEVLSAKKPAKFNLKWLLQIFIVSLVLSIVFTLLSQVILNHSNLVLSICLISVLIFISVIADIIGVAVTACSVKPILDMVENKKRGAKFALSIVKKADKTSSICSDVIGDICSILSGAGGVSITIQILSMCPSVSNFFLSLFINALLASLSILGKAIGKTYALSNPLKIVLSVGKCCSIFSRK